MKGLVGFSVLAAFLFAMVVSRGASAQYPPADGSVTATAANGNPTVNSETEITARVLDISGNAVAGVSCTFAIVNEPGTDAAIGSKSTTRVTNAQGIATAVLKAGSTPGLIAVRVTCGTLQSQVLALARTPLPPAAPVEISGPSTGDGGLLP